MTPTVEACPMCRNTLGNAVPHGSPDHLRCATCKHVWRVASPTPPDRPSPASEAMIAELTERYESAIRPADHVAITVVQARRQNLLLAVERHLPALLAALAAEQAVNGKLRAERDEAVALAHEFAAGHVVDNAYAECGCGLCDRAALLSAP